MVDMLGNAQHLGVDDFHLNDVDAIRARITATRDEIEALQRTPVPSDDLEMRIAHYVGELAAKAQPIITGIGNAQSLRVLFPLTDSADRISQSYFAEAQGNALLLAAFVDPERLTERLLRLALAGSLSAAERSERLSTLQQQLIDLRYAEEVAVSAAISSGDDVSRSGSAPAWAILMVAVEQQQAAAA